MRIELFLPPVAIAFVLSGALSLLFLLGSRLVTRTWRTGSRHDGKTHVSRFGGLAVVSGFIGAVLLDEHLVLSREIWGLLTGGVFIALVGLWDDFHELSFKAQGFFQVAVTVIVFIFGIRISAVKNPFGDVLILPEQGVWPILLGFLLLLAWMVLVLNAVNWLDGLDGLLGSVSLIVFFVIFFLSLKPEVNQPPVALLAFAALGAVLGFLLFNIHPARILAGTSGSFFIGFLIAALAVIAGTKIATALLVLILPVADALFVIGARLRAGVSIFEADERHLHYRLRALGWSERRIVAFFILLTGSIGGLALATVALGKFVAFLLVLTLVLVFLFWVERELGRKKPTLSSV